MEGKSPYEIVGYEDKVRELLPLVVPVEIRPLHIDLAEQWCIERFGSPMLLWTDGAWAYVWKVDETATWTVMHAQFRFNDEKQAALFKMFWGYYA